jgi:hypothetical protein
MVVIALIAALVLSACGGDPVGSSTESASQPGATVESAPTADPIDEASADELFPDIIDATATMSADGTWDFSATVSSPYDSPDRYADAWRVLAPDGTELGVRELTHDHAGEQPFTRTLFGVEIPARVDIVTIEGRDQVNGWGGDTVEVELQP